MIDRMAWGFLGISFLPVGAVCLAMSAAFLWAAIKGGRVHG